MGKKKEKHGKKPTSSMPFVSVCTPTYNRRPFFSTLFECFKNQDYPMSRIEWIIVDDGTDKVKDLIDAANIPQIKYFELDEKKTLGFKRNYMHDQSKGSIIVYMDDDDYYPPDRISHAVDRLLKNPKALCAGSSELYIYFKHIQKMYQFGPYGPNHATAGTFAFRRDLLKITRYNESACLAEEKEFLHNYTIPFVQLDPLRTILVFSHNQNTFDKKKLLNSAPNKFTKESDKTVNTFIRRENEESIKKFFMEDIDPLLETYAPGDPSMKPDVLKQMKEIEEQRAKMVSQQTPMVSQPGKPPEQLDLPKAINIIQSMQETLRQRDSKIKELEEKIKLLETK
jgi:glycosyltransferase involved in cell wall biosynthesis